jgi:5-methyltetrahydrofolate--homocysteine methyltransferase
MARRQLAGLISVQPNAGLPELVDGQTHYPLGPRNGEWLERFVAEDGVNMIGGCCGTDGPHIAALDAMLRRRGGPGPAPVRANRSGCRRSPRLYGQVPLRQENAIFDRRALQRQRLEEMARAAGKAATGTAASRWAASRSAKARNALDICTAFVGRDEIAEMTEVITRFTARSTRRW